MHIASRRLLLPLAVILIAALGCTPPPKEYDWDSGGDESRDRAKSLFIGQNVSERISDPDGDHTDWKVVRVRESGSMSVTIAVDNTRGMDGFISLKDSFGVELDRKPLNASDVLYTFDKIPVYQGDYYIELKIEQGSSPYTAGVSFEALPKVATNEIFIPPPDPPNGGGGGRVKPGTGPVAPPTSVASAPTTAPPEEIAPPVEPAGDSTVTLKGYIVRIAPREEGGSLLTITGLGSADGVKSGMSGTILGLNAPFQVTAAAPRAAYAFTKAEAEDVKLHKNVTLTFKR